MPATTRRLFSDCHSCASSPAHCPTCPLQDATSLAFRLIANYGLSPLGVTTWAPAPRRSNALKERSFEVTGAPGVHALLLWQVLAAGLLLQHPEQAQVWVTGTGASPGADDSGAAVQPSAAPFCTCPRASLLPQPRSHVLPSNSAKPSPQPLPHPAVESIDADLFASSISGGGFQPSDENRHKWVA